MNFRSIAMKTDKVKRLFLAALVLLCLVGCAGNAAQHLSQQDEVLAGLLPLPDELRGTRGVEILTLAGTTTIRQSSGFEAPILEPGVGLMDATDGGPFEWAVYSFIVNPGELNAVNFVAESRAPGSSCFVALADFEAGRWVFNERFDLPESGVSNAPAIGPIDPAKHEDGEGNYFAAIIVPVGSSVAVHSMEGTVIVNDAPVAAVIATPQQADAPVSVTYDANTSSDIDGTIVQYEWDMQSDGVFEVNTGDVPTHSVNHASPAIVNVTVRVTDDDGATDTASTQALITQNGNVPPTAVLESDVSEGDGEVGFSATFSSDQSSDLDGSIALYEWDLDGDGSTGTNGFEVSSATPDEQTVQFDAPGERTVRLRVTDDGGLRSIDTLKIVSHGWVVIDTQTGGSSAFGYSLAQIGKGPAIAVGTGTTVRYSLSSSSFGTLPEDWDSVELGSGGGGSSSLALVEGRAAIAAQRSGLRYLRHRSGSALDFANWDQVAVTNVGGIDCSLLVVDGNPAIAHHTSGSEKALAYARSSTALGTLLSDWSSITIDDNDTIAGQGCSLALINGKPAVSYIFAGPQGDRLRYAHSTTASGAAAEDWQIVEPVSGFETQLFTSLAEVDGRPAFAFLNPGNNGLVLASAVSSDGALAEDWNACVVDANIQSSDKITLALIGGLPSIGYANNVPAGVSLASSTTPDGQETTDWQLDEDGIDGDINNTAVALAEINGYPAVVFTGTGNVVMYGIRF